MDWAQDILLSGPAEELLAFAGLAAVVWMVALIWEIRWRIRERAEIEEERRRPVFEHRFLCEPVLKQVTRQRASLFARHRTPTGTLEARTARVTTARAQMHDEDFFQGKHEDIV